MNAPTCPHCGLVINIGRIIGSRTSTKKKLSSAANGRNRWAGHVRKKALKELGNLTLPVPVGPAVMTVDGQPVP